MSVSRLVASLRTVRQNFHLLRIECGIEKLSLINIVPLQIGAKQVLLPHSNARKLPMIRLSLLAIVNITCRISRPMPEQLGKIDKSTLRNQHKKCQKYVCLHRFIMMDIKI